MAGAAKRIEEKLKRNERRVLLGAVRVSNALLKKLHVNGSSYGIKQCNCYHARLWRRNETILRTKKDKQ